MVKVIKRKRRSSSLSKFLPFIFLFLVAGGAYFAFFLAQHKQDVRQFAAASPTATIGVSPSSQSVNVGSTFTVNMVVDGGGQAFNAAQATVAVSPNLSIVSLNNVASASGGCNFNYVDSQTPTTSNLSFAGAILKTSSSSCTVYSVTLQAQSAGTGTITITNGSVKAYADSSEIFSSSINGQYTIGTGVITPTPTTTSTITPTPTLVSRSASESLISTSQTLSPGNTFKVQVHEDSSSTQINAAQAVISYPSNILQFAGFDDTSVIPNFGINAQETSNTSQITVSKGSINPLTGDQVITTLTFTALQSGQASLTLDPTNSKVFTSSDNTNILQTFNNAVINITLNLTPTPTSALQCPASAHAPGDINGDSVVDISDVSLLFRNWHLTTGNFLDQTADLNCDGVVDLTDFSILAKFYQGS